MKIELPDRIGVYCAFIILVVISFFAYYAIPPQPSLYGKFLALVSESTRAIYAHDPQKKKSDIYQGIVTICDYGWEECKRRITPINGVIAYYGFQRFVADFSDFFETTGYIRIANLTGDEKKHLIFRVGVTMPNGHSDIYIDEEHTDTIYVAELLPYATIEREIHIRPLLERTPITPSMQISVSFLSKSENGGRTEWQPVSIALDYKKITSIEVKIDKPRALVWSAVNKILLPPFSNGLLTALVAFLVYFAYEAIKDVSEGPPYRAACYIILYAGSNTLAILYGLLFLTESFLTNCITQVAFDALITALICHGIALLVKNASKLFMRSSWMQP